MSELARRFQWPIVLVLLLAGAAFLLKMCYLSLAFNTAFGLAYLTAFYFYVRARYGLVVPPLLLGLVLLGVEVDALGNYFRMYGNQFGPMQYDEFAHLTIQVLVTPLIVWLLRKGLERFGQQLSLGLTTFFAGATIFGLSAFYEIIELWDELHFGGHRIWSTRDTATDLQFDLCGIVVGAALAYVLLGRVTVRVARGQLRTTV
jgi:uncharacterized membrane protein YjdF